MPKTADSNVAGFFIIIIISSWQHTCRRQQQAAEQARHFFRKIIIHRSKTTSPAGSALISPYHVKSTTVDAYACMCWLSMAVVADPHPEPNEIPLFLVLFFLHV